MDTTTALRIPPSPARLNQPMPDTDALTAAINALTEASKAQAAATQAQLGQVLTTLGRVDEKVGGQAVTLGQLLQWKEEAQKKLDAAEHVRSTTDQWRGGLAVGLLVLGCLQGLAFLWVKAELDRAARPAPAAVAPRSP